MSPERAHGGNGKAGGGRRLRSSAAAVAVAAGATTLALLLGSSEAADEGAVTGPAAARPAPVAAAVGTPAGRAVAAASRRGEIALGSADPGFRTTTDRTRRDYFDDAEVAAVDTVRLNAFWFQVAPTQPADPRDPADPAYDFASTDAGVRTAAARGIRVLITLQRAPEWAESEQNEEERGAHKPDPGAFADYVAAVVSRYSGEFPDPQKPGKTLPRVRHFQLWNEGNHHAFLAPQREGGEFFAAEHFRRLVNAGYDEVKSADPDNVVIVGGTSPVGPSNEDRTGPLAFWRQVFCLTVKLKPRSGCSEPLRFDVFDHHPLGRTHSPRYLRDGWITAGNYRKLRKALRAAEAAGHTFPDGIRRPMWATELYWATNPPDERFGFRPPVAAKYLEEAIYLLWRQGVSLGLNFFLVDPGERPPGQPGLVQGGLFFEDRSPKPSLTAFRFPLVSDRRDGRALIWGRSPAAGKVRIEVRRGGRWRRLDKLEVSAGRHFELEVRKLRRGARLRARVGGERSLTWRHLRPPTADFVPDP